MVISPCDPDHSLTAVDLVKGIENRSSVPNSLLEYGPLRDVVLLARDWRPDEILIEDASAGTALIQQLNADTALPVIGVRPISSKPNRAMSVLGLIESRRVSVHERAEWLDDFLGDVCSFPSGRFDDLTDALVQGLRHLVDSPVPGIYVF